MKTRKLGRTGFQVSEVGLGCWAIGGNAYGEVQDEASLDALAAAWEQGVNFYDTADTYGEGHSEILLGKFLKTVSRGSAFIATKVGWDFYPSDLKAVAGVSDTGPKLNHVGHRKNFDPRHICFACEQSLRRLRTDAIDLYQLHNPSLDLIRQGDAVGVLAGLKKEGKIRAVGISVHTEEEALAALQDTRVEVLQVIFNLLDQRMAVKVFGEAKQKNVGIVVREPLASGLLTGKYPPEHEFPKNDHRRRWSKEKREWDWEKIRLIRKELREDEIPLSQAALEFALAFSEISTVIPGAKTRTQVLQNLRAAIGPRLTTGNIWSLSEVYHKEAVFRKGLLPS